MGGGEGFLLSFLMERQSDLFILADRIQDTSSENQGNSKICQREQLKFFLFTVRTVDKWNGTPEITGSGLPVLNTKGSNPGGFKRSLKQAGQ